jgi:peptide/nickel transport system permease protein
MTATAVTPRVALLSRTKRSDTSRTVAWLSVSLLGVVTLIAVFARVIAPYDPTALVGMPFLPPFSPGHALGTDAVGRDVLSRVIVGIQTTWPLALIVVALGVTVGLVVGAVAGVLGGWVDAVLMRITDIFLSLPAPIVAIAIVAALGPSVTNLLIGISLVWWPYFARIFRGEVRAFMSRPHVEAAKLSGALPARIAIKHVLPGILPTVVVLASVDVGAAILMISGLSFLGLGTPPPQPELGADAAAGMAFLLQAWWAPIMPALAVFLLTIIGNVAGNGVRQLMAGK